jgi:hypothetical protein
MVNVKEIEKAMALTSQYKHQCEETGVIKWVENTPDQIKQLENDIRNALVKDGE